MKQLLIISPSFPPVNAADMHRVRQSVSYFEEMGWKPTVVAVKPELTEYNQDELLVQTLPEGLEVLYVSAFSTRFTRKIGLGSLGLRSLWFYYQVVTKLLKTRKFDLIYFSTTMFPVMILGGYWKKRFGTPYVIDMQDPWHSDFYKNKPKNERPPKYWFSYRLNKWMEPMAMKQVSGIVSVSQGYCDMLQARYANITAEKCTVIPFGAFDKDFVLAEKLKQKIKNPFFDKEKDPSLIHCAYVGRGGNDMATALHIIFSAFKNGLETNPGLFSRLRFHFIGTSYAPGDKGKKTILPVAEALGLGSYVTESPARVAYFTSLRLLSGADMLLVPGSADPNYTASKLYPYILSKKPLLAVFSSTSSVVQILNSTQAGEAVIFTPGNDAPFGSISDELLKKWTAMLQKLPFQPETKWEAFAPYTAREMTRKQVQFFEKVAGLG